MLTRVKILDDRAVLPKRAHESDTGYDIKLIDVHKIVGDVIFFKTGLSLQPPKGHYFEIVPRSSISKLPLELANSIGIVDEHYRGELIVAVRVTHQNMGQEHKNTQFPGGIVRIFDGRPNSMSAVAYSVLNKKPVLFQIILRERLDCTFESVFDLEETERGDGGFGSTDDDGWVETITKSSVRKELRTQQE
jgi:dUTP pyrophosphatase